MKLFIFEGQTQQSCPQTAKYIAQLKVMKRPPMSLGKPDQLHKALHLKK